MLRRKPSKIEVTLEDKEELLQQHHHQSRVTTPTSAVTSTPASAATASATTTTAAAALLHHFDRPSTRSQRIVEKMEVEVKLRLPDSAAHQSLSSILSPFFQKTHFQHNFFFDGALSELSSRRAILRIRFYGVDPGTAERCVLSLKAKAVIVNGVSRVEEDEEELDPSMGRAIWSDPNLIGSGESRILKRVREEFGVKEESGYVCVGGFKNVRGVYDWNGLKLEVDETLFDFGTSYEVECESSEPHKAKEMIEGLLKQNGIPYSNSIMSKFAIFRAGQLPPMAGE